MNPTLDHLSELSRSIPVPENYREGVRIQRRILVDNAVLFHRATVHSLKRRNFADRLHHRYVFICVLKTEGTVCLDGLDMILHPGQALLVLPYQLHFYKDLKSEELSWLYITFEVDRGESDLRVLGQNPVTLSPPSVERLRKVVLAWKERSVREDAAETILWEMGLVLESLVSEELKGSLPIAHPGNKDKNPWIVKIMARIRESMEEGTTLCELANEVGITERHLRSRFRRETGYSPREYRDKLRYIMAFRLIRESELYFGQIAEQTGFSSLSSFSRFIQKNSGYTPKTLRSMLQNQSYPALEKKLRTEATA